MSQVSGISSNILSLYYQNMLASAKQKTSGSNNATDPLDELVSAGTITQDQEDAIKSSLQTAGQKQSATDSLLAGLPEDTSSILQQLLNADPATQDQQDKLQSEFQSLMKMQQAQAAYNFNTKSSDALDSLLNPTQSQDGTSDPLGELISSLNSDTQDDQDSMESDFTSILKMQQAQEAYSLGNRTTSPLGSLVQSGAINQDQENAVYQAIQKSVGSQLDVTL